MRLRSCLVRNFGNVLWNFGRDGLCGLVKFIRITCICFYCNNCYSNVSFFFEVCDDIFILMRTKRVFEIRCFNVTKVLQREIVELNHFEINLVYLALSKRKMFKEHVTAIT